MPFWSRGALLCTRHCSCLNKALFKALLFLPIFYKALLLLLILYKVHCKALLLLFVVLKVLALTVLCSTGWEGDTQQCGSGRQSPCPRVWRDKSCVWWWGNLGRRGGGWRSLLRIRNWKKKKKRTLLETTNLWKVIFFSLQDYVIFRDGDILGVYQ